MGRKTKLTHEVIEKVVELIKIGSTYELAAKGAGIGKTSFYKYLELGNSQESGIFADFANAIKNAERESLKHLLSRIVKAADKSWQAAAWLLERRYPNDYARPMRNVSAGPELDISEQRAELRSIVGGKVLQIDGGDKGSNGKGNGTK